MWEEIALEKKTKGIKKKKWRALLTKINFLT